MSTGSRILGRSVCGALALVALAATAQGTDSYVVVEERSTYYAPRVTVEHRHASEDTLITQDVKAVFESDPRLDPSHISVETERNVVRLAGLVSSPGQAIIAARDAQGVAGVSEVRNYIRSRVGDTSSR